MSAQETKALIAQAVEGFQAAVPALAPLKMVLGLELRGKHDVQMYRVELPGPKITKDSAHDAKVRLEVQRADFNRLAAEPTTAGWRAAFRKGHAKASGPVQLTRLIANVVEKHDERERLIAQSRRRA